MGGMIDILAYRELKQKGEGVEMTTWHGSGIHSNIRRFFCWLFGCNYQDYLGGGWCVDCGADQENYQGPVWRRR